MKRFVCLCLSLILFISTTSVSSAEECDFSTLEWQDVESYIYDNENKSYSVKIQQRTEQELGNEYVAQYRFIVDCNGNKVQYYSEIYSRKDSPKNIIEAIQEDNYLRLDITEMPGIRKKLQQDGIDYLCLDCHEECSVIYVCRHCKGDLSLKSNKKYVCNDCGKSQAASVRKDVCSKCRGKNYIKTKALWNTTTDWQLEDVRQYFELPEKYIFIENALKMNWQNSIDPNIIIARETLNLDWEQALNLYQNPGLVGKLESEYKTIIINAVYTNQQYIAHEFTTSETQDLYEKYKIMYSDFIFSILNYYAPEDTGETIEWIYKLLKRYYGLTDKTEFSEVLKTIFEEMQNSYIDEEFSDDEIYEIWKELKGNIDYALEIGNEIVDLWFTLEQDFSNYYKEYNYIVNRDNAKRSALKGLCDEIILAETIKNTLN